MKIICNFFLCKTKSSFGLTAMIKVGLTLLFFCLLCGLNAQIIDSVTLQKQKLFTSLDDAIANPSVVFRLNLSKQHLENIPESVFTLTNLQELDISDNNIEYIPSGIEKLRNLQTIDISNNKLKTLPAEIGNLINLKYLLLNRNHIEILPDEISKLVSLTKLDLWGNRIIQLPSQISLLRKSLKELDMRAITIKSEYRNAILDLLPETDIYFTGCNCN
jgi:Leucine-rich repeat (LRR) protein